MKINKLYDDVYEIEKFLTQEQLLKVFEIIDNTSEESWFDYTKPETDFWNGKNIYFDQYSVFDEINDKMKNLLESYSYYPGALNLSRYKKGDFINYHSDQWIPDLDYYIGYGFCLYYNDNYLGGELEYPDLNIKVKPKANSLYIHGGHIVHGSLPVLSDDIRYFSTVFVHGTNEQQTILRRDIFQ